MDICLAQLVMRESMATWHWRIVRDGWWWDGGCLSIYSLRLISQTLWCWWGLSFSAFSCTVVMYVVLKSEVRTSAPGSWDFPPYPNSPPLLPNTRYIFYINMTHNDVLDRGRNDVRIPPLDSYFLLSCAPLTTHLKAQDQGESRGQHNTGLWIRIHVSVNLFSTVLY